MVLVSGKLTPTPRLLLGVQEKLCFFLKDFIILPPLHRQHLTVIGRSAIRQLVGVNLQYQCVENFDTHLDFPRP